MQIKPKIKMTKASYVAYRTTYDELAAILKQIKAAHVTDKTTSDGAAIEQARKQLEDAQKVGKEDECPGGADRNRLFQADERRTDDPAAGVQQILHVEAPHKSRDAW